MGDGFTVDTEEVRSHAGNVEGFAGRADVAADAGAHLTTLDDAYGLACQQFGQMLVEPQTKGTEGLVKAAGLLHVQADALNASADEYDACEQRVSDLIKDLLERLNDLASNIPQRAGGN